VFPYRFPLRSYRERSVKVSSEIVFHAKNQQDNEDNQIVLILNILITTTSNYYNDFTL